MAVSNKSKKELIEENKTLRLRLQELEHGGIKDYGSSERELRRSHERLLTVLDSLDAFVYVADMETYEVLFVNKFGRNIWGDVVGKTCWKALQSGQTGPCEFCTNAKLIGSSGKPTGIYRWECQNTVDRQWYECRDQVIRWTDDRLVRMEIATNITERKQQERLAGIQRDLAVKLSATAKLEDGLSLCLEAAIEASEMDCGGIYLVDEDSGALELAVHKELSDGFVNSGFHYDADSDHLKLVMKGEPVYTEYKQLSALLDQTQKHDGLSSIAVLPILDKDRVIGCLNVASHMFKQIHAQSRLALETITAQIGSTVARLKTADALRESEERYRLAVQAAQLSTWDWDLLTNEVHLGGHSTEALGLAPDVMSMPLSYFLDHVNPEDLERVHQAYNRAINERILYNEEYRIIQPDGTERWIAAQGQSVYDQTGKAVRMIGVNQDITEQKKAEEELQESEANLNEAQHMAHLGNWFWDVKTGEVEWSDEVYSIFRLDPEEFTPQIDSILALSPWPEDHQRDKELIRRALESREQGSYEQRFLYPDGSAGYYFSTFQGIYDDSGDLVAIKGTVQDVTEQKKAEEQLQNVFNLSLDMVCIADLNTNTFIKVNPAFESTLGYTEEELLGRPFIEFIHPEDVDKTLHVVREKLRRGLEDINFENRYRCKDDSYRWLSWVSQPVPEEGLIYAIAHDVTERKKAEEELNRTKGLLQAAIEQTPAGIVIADAPDVKIRVANSAALGIRGETTEPLMEIPADLHPEKWQLFYLDGTPYKPEDLPLSRAILKGQITKNEEIIMRRQNGEDRFVLTNAAPVRNTEGQVIAGIAVFPDITELKRMEEAYHSLVDHSIQGLTIIQDERIVFTNKAFSSVTGYSEEDVLAASREHIRSCVHPEDREMVWARHRDRLAGKPVPPCYEFRWIRKDGSICWVEIYANRIEYQGRPAIQTAFIDITERKETEDAIRESEEKFRTLAEQSPNMIFINREGRIVYANKKCEEIMGYKREEFYSPDFDFLTLIAPQSLDLIKEYFRMQSNGLEIPPYEYTLINKAGERIEVINSCKLIQYDGRMSILGIITDITERKKIEQERESTIHLLHLINASNDMHEVAGLVTNFLMDCSGCEAFAIRLESSEDFPYFETCGFSKEFILAENRLFLMNEPGELIRDSNGKPYLECMCGNVIRGRFDPSKPFFTELGSFWTNSTTELLASTTEADRLAGTRNHCNTAGYESVALIPLRAGGETFGLLQFNDKQKGRFTPDKISLMERLADHLAIGLAHMRAEQALKQSEAKYRSLIANIPDVVWTSDEKGNTTFISENIKDVYGYSPEEIYTQSDKLWFGRIHPDDIEKVAESFKAVFEKGEQLDIEYRIKRKDGQWIWIRDRSIGAYEKDGVKYADGVFSDITERKKAQEALRRSEEKFRSMFELSPYSTVFLDLEGNIIACNQRFAELHATKEGPEAQVGRSASEFFPEEERSHISSEIQKVAAGKNQDQFEYTMLREDGTKFRAETKSTLVMDEHGKPQALLAMANDITERRQAEDKLRQSEERFKILFESAPDAYYIHDLDGHFIDGNKAAEQLIGYGREEVIGDNFINLNLVTEEDIPTVIKAMEDNKDGKPAGPLELTLYRKDGSKVMVETRSYPVEIDGQTVVLGIARDITERKKAEMALRQSEQRLKILFESAPDAIFLSDLKGNIVDGNTTAEKMLGYAEDELIGENLLQKDLLSSEQVLRAIASLEKTAMGKPTGPDEFTLTRKDGSTVPVEIRTFPVKIGDQVLSLGIARDISARKKDEKKLFEYRTQLKSLASELSLTEERERHRLATDLHDHISQSLVFSRIKLQELHASVSSAEIAVPLEEACDNLDQIIQDTRTLTFDLSSPILYELGFEAAVSGWLEEQIGRKHGIKTQFEDDGRPKPLEDDIRVLLFRNVRELLINIVKHADAQNVKVSLNRISDEICVSVEDDGIGFNPSEVASKAGFGIFSIRERLEQLSGHIEIESESGQGTKITMTAPLKCDEISREDQLKS